MSDKSEAVAAAESSEWWRCPKDDSRWRDHVRADAMIYGEFPICPRCATPLEPCEAPESVR